MAYLGRQPNTGVRSRYIYTATASQTTFSGSDDDGKTLKYEDAAYLDVFLNGVLLKPVTDYTATSKTSVVLTSGAAASDVVEIVAYDIANIADTVSKANGGTFDAGVTVNGTVTADGLTVDTDTLYVDAANNLVGIGTTLPEAKLEIEDGGTSKSVLLKVTADDSSPYALVIGNDTFSTSDTDGLAINVNNSGDAIINARGTGSELSFRTVGTERARISSTGALLVHKTTPDQAVEGMEFAAGNYLLCTKSGGTTAYFNRTTSDGTIAEFRKDGTTVGDISFETAGFSIDGESNHTGIQFGGIAWVPRNNGVNTDNYVDLGYISGRFDDIYATNPTIQTSDANEKQQIASLTDAEITAAKAISKIFKTFKWNDKVAEKGDAARTHTGVIAQEVQQAMTDSGLDAGNYAFFIRGVWWEADETYTDDDGVEQTRTNTYATAEEAPADAVERTRLGIRYPELLAFIGAATEQRLTSIEARLATLENA